MSAKTVNMNLVRQLRETTGAGILDCKHALMSSGGDLEGAITILRKKGIETASKKSSRVTREGRIETYLHHGGKIGVLVEVDCETDFVAKNEEFKRFIKDVAMQVAAANPRFIHRDEVPVEMLEAERDIIKEQMKGKSAKAVEKAVPGKLEKFYQQVCLLEQAFIRDDKVFIKDLLSSLIAKTGENIIIKRFARFQVGVE